MKCKVEIHPYAVVSGVHQLLNALDERDIREIGAAGEKLSAFAAMLAVFAGRERSAAADPIPAPVPTPESPVFPAPAAAASGACALPSQEIDVRRAMQCIQKYGPMPAWRLEDVLKMTRGTLLPALRLYPQWVILPTDRRTGVSLTDAGRAVVSKTPSTAASSSPAA